jgi:3-oxoacyl-[acyl-carrier protein] reductase
MKYALVTGGSRGIGREICLQLADMGYPVLINYTSNDEAANETKSMIEEKGGTAELLKFDVSDIKQVDDALEGWMTNNPDDVIEVLVNNAGIRKDNLLLWMTNEDWNSVMDISLNGFFYVTRRLIKEMLTNRYGRIVNVVSLSGLKGLPGQANYSAAKAGIIGATKALSQEVAKRNVTVNAVAPGFIHTDMTKELDEKSLKALIPMNRFGKAEEVADLVSFLASKKASYITGQTISINGGLYT